MHELITFPNVIQVLLAVGIGVSSLYYLTCYLGARTFFRPTWGAQGDLKAEAYPGVTILKPLKGLEPGLYDNLASFCRQDYPRFQVVFGVADADDEAVGIVRQLQGDFPAVDIDLVIDGRIYGSNYKISNLHNMYQAARHDLLVIADSDIRVPPGYLKHTIRELAEPGVGIVTSLYRAASTGGLPTLIESLFVNTDFAPSILVARIVETRRYAFGASIALRRSVLEEAGGFLSLANYLADDYYLGNRVAARGYRIALSSLVVETVLAVGSWKRLLDHQLRWARTYRSCRPASYFALIITHGTFWATANLLWNAFNPLAWATAAVVYGLRVITARAVADRYLGAPLSWHQALLVLPKDLFTSLIWLLCFLDDTVRWSGNEFRVLRDGQMIRVASEVPRKLASYGTPKSAT
jgi:ceramide glucosyltransferase